MICSCKQKVVWLWKSKFIYIIHFDSLVFHSVYKTGPLENCDVCYIHEMSVQITKSLWLSHQESERCYLGITEGRYL
jgi:hypothetical protein